MSSFISKGISVTAATIYFDPLVDGDEDLFSYKMEF